MAIREKFAWLSYKDIEMLEKLKVAFDAVADHVVITDKDANILYANGAVEKMTGFPLEEVIGKNPADLWGGNMPQDIYEKMWHTIKTEKKPYVGEVQNKRKDGTFYWQEVHISPVLDDLGEAKFFIGIEPNITDRKEREKFSEEFVSILAHQLKNLLTTIRWALESVFGSGRLTLKDGQALQAFQNLITNAFEYSDKTAPQVALTVSQEKERYLFSCENNGLSIPKEEQSKIFSKFFRAS